MLPLSHAAAAATTGVLACCDYSCFKLAMVIILFFGIILHLHLNALENSELYFYIIRCILRFS